MESRTLAQLRSEARYLADAEGSTSRHPDADVNRQINAAIRAYRAFVTSHGLPYYLTTTTPATLASTVATGTRYSSVPWPSSALEIRGVAVASSTDADDWYPLTPTALLPEVFRSRAQRPEYYAVLRVPEAAGSSSVTAGELALMPGTEDGAYRITYLAEFTDLSEDAHVFLALPDGVQFVIQTVVMALSQRDDDQNETYAIASRRKDEAAAAIELAATRARQGGPLLPRRRARWGRRRG